MLRHLRLLRFFLPALILVPGATPASTVVWRASPGPGMACWYEGGAAPQQIVASKPKKRVAASPRPRHKTKRIRKVVRGPKPARPPKVRPSRNIAPSAPAGQWICVSSTEPAPALPPFSISMAEAMQSYPADEALQQWIIDRRTPKRRRFREAPVSLAPEPGSWMLLVLGFGVVGYALRRRRFASLEDIRA